MLDTVVRSGEDVCCSVVFTLCLVVRVADAICYLLSPMVISVRVPESGLLTSPVRTECGTFVI